MAELHQQDIMSFRPGDQVLIIQNGREMKIKIEAFIEAIAAATANFITMAQDEAIAEPMQEEIDNLEEIIDENLPVSMPTVPDISVPQSPIANPASIVTANVLGITVAVGGGVSSLQGTVQSILNALRAAKVISP